MKRHKTTDNPGVKPFKKGDIGEAMKAAKKIKADFNPYRTRKPLDTVKKH